MKRERKEELVYLDWPAEYEGFLHTDLIHLSKYLFGVRYSSYKQV